jgi:hypothetical protein
VILAQGIVGSMHRSVLTGMQMLAPAPHPVRVFGAIPGAVHWLVPYIREACSIDASGDDVIKAVDAHAGRFAARLVKAPAY